MNEFTGERVVPGEVNVDLWNEHLSRYAFAARLAEGKRVLDLGCGTGYGSAELARTAGTVAGADIAPQAIEHARANYRLPNLEFTVAPSTALPYADSSFDVVVCFEVIEHLADWRGLVREAARVLGQDGLFLVSTPNRLYYAESRKTAGPNPFHEHEFEFDEFRDALAETFPAVDVLLQNRTECFAFYPPRAGREVDARLDASAGTPADAHFFLAICSHRAQPALRNFVYVPQAANILKEREAHIAKLDGELRLNQDWLAEARGERDALHAKLHELKEHLEGQNRWARDLEQRLRALEEQFVREQRASVEMAQGYEAKVAELEADIQSKTAWALETERRLTADIEAERDRHRATLGRLEAAENLAAEHHAAAAGFQARLEEAESRIDFIRASRWIALGRRIGLGPQL